MTNINKVVKVQQYSDIHMNVASPPTKTSFPEEGIFPDRSQKH